MGKTLRSFNFSAGDLSLKVDRGVNNSFQLSFDPPLAKDSAAAVRQALRQDQNLVGRLVGYVSKGRYTTMRLTVPFSERGVIDIPNIELRRQAKRKRRRRAVAV